MSSWKSKTRDNITTAKHKIRESVYEIYLDKMLKEAREKLKKLKENPKVMAEQLEEVEGDIQNLEALYENYDEAMDVFK